MNKKLIKIILIVLIVLILIGLIVILGINFYVKSSTRVKIIDESKALNLEDVDCILVLGAGVRNGKPSPMLKDRLEVAISLYEKGAAGKLLMSGDHGKKDYDEVNLMKNYAINSGIAGEDIFMDHAGFSTYESIYRAKYIFKAQKIIIVTQEYHLYRALYIAKSLGLEAYGVSATLDDYSGQTTRELREILARDKDFFLSIFKPKPTYLGEEIPVWGNGDITNDITEVN